MENSRVNGPANPADIIKVRVGSLDFEPAWTFLSEFQLSRRGLTLSEVLTKLNLAKPESVHLGMELLASMMAHLYPERSSFEWAAMVATGQYPEIIRGLIMCGRRDGAIVDRKNAQTPAQIMPPAIDVPVA